jgi:hypothetical protein
VQVPPARERTGSAGGSESAPPETQPAETAPILDPARAAATVVPDLGPPPPPQPLEMRVPTLRISPRRPRSELAPDGNGRFRIKDGPVIAHVERDGRVSFEDQSPIGVHVARPHDIKRRLKAWIANPFAEAPADIPPIIEGHFELTDLAMRAAGQDPYSSRKMELLDRTRDERMALAAGENASNLRDALARTPATLERIWRGPGDARHKRRLLFTLWDECAESGASDVVTTARAVRASILAFIRRRLPRGSRAAYSARELDALNAGRTSRERFEPYWQESATSAQQSP